MIFITVGTTNFPFVRMAHIFEAVCGYRHKNELIIFQHGATPMETTAKNVVTESYLDFVTMNKYLCQARVVICHGGPATIYQCLYVAKKPFVLPREKRFGEHVNDHQVVFCKYLQQRRLIRLLNLQNIQLTKHTVVKPLSLFHSTRGQLIRYLDELIGK